MPGGHAMLSSAHSGSCSLYANPACRRSVGDEAALHSGSQHCWLLCGSERGARWQQLVSWLLRRNRVIKCNASRLS